jgi:D-3-phosphoglycerate dehydrogenase / 2-oxoglutarate reductase
MAKQAKVVLTDYVWDSLDVEKNTLEGLAELVALKTKSAEEFLPYIGDCDAVLNTYTGPITADVMARMPNCKIIARYGIGVDTIDIEAATRAGIRPTVSRKLRNMLWLYCLPVPARLPSMIGW